MVISGRDLSHRIMLNNNNNNKITISNEEQLIDIF